MIKIKCGLEIHGQLNTCKLFCNCPSMIRDDEPDVKIKRVMKIAAGESGEVDKAALHEQKKKKYFLYEAYRDTNCLVEMDEQPPNSSPNKDALLTTLEIANMLKCKTVDYLQFMRKIVVDGSNTTGFQRTGLIAYDGELNVGQKKIGIQTVCLEEDAAKIIERNEEFDVYRLDKLGIPLIEIATDPDITSGKEAIEVAEKIGMIIRSSGKAKRGLGTIRQDLNISIEGGARIEIKGAQELYMIESWVENEAKRQEKLLDVKNKLSKIKFEHGELIDLKDIFKNSESNIVKNLLKEGIYGMNFSGFEGIFGFELNEKTKDSKGRRFATELSDYAKHYAKVGGIFHGDELPNYGITDKDVIEIKKKLNVDEKDSFILVGGSKEKARISFDTIIERIKTAYQKIPGEVRKPNPDGTSSFMRPMPGADRMYPETDVPLMKIEEIKIPKIELIDEKIKKYEKLGLEKNLAKEIAYDYFDVFEMLTKKFDLKPSFIADKLIGLEKELRRSFSIEREFSDDDYLEIFNAYKRGISSEKLLSSVVEFTRQKKNIKFDIENTLTEKEVIDKLKQKGKEFFEMPMGKQINDLIKEFGDRADGKVISNCLRNYK